MSKRKITVGVVTIILLVVGSVWAFRSRTDPQVEKIKQLQAEAVKKGRLRNSGGKTSIGPARKWINSARTSAAKSGARCAKVFNGGWTNRSRNTSPCPRRTGSLIWINKSTKWRNGEKNGKRAVPNQANPALKGRRPAGGGQQGAPGPADKAARSARARQRRSVAAA